MSEENLGTECPRCGHKWTKPEWRCPECYYEFGTDVSKGRNDRHAGKGAGQQELPLIDDLPEHCVQQPRRATEKHSSQYTRRGIGIIANVVALPLGGLLALALAAADNSEGLRMAGYAMLGIGAFILVITGQVPKGLDLIEEGQKVPRMATPADTLATFFRALRHPGFGADDRPHRFLARAFNCLTDTAQQTIGSIDSFSRHWDSVSYGWAPDISNMHVVGLSKSRMTARVRVKIETAHMHKATSKMVRGKIEKDLVLVERSGFWFMTDGIFLSDREGVQS